MKGIFGKNDVYVEIQIGDRASVKTRVLKGAGSDAVFTPPASFQLYVEI